MNKGLKKYTKQISLTVGNAAETSINVNKKDANLHISLPLITTIGLCPIETSLTFNVQDKGESYLFGKGFKLNFFNRITSSGTTIKVKNSDGSTDEYNSVNDYKNKETNLEVRKIIDDNYGDYHYEMKDKYDNVTMFNKNQYYPKSIAYKNGNKITTDFVAATKYIKNGKGDEVRFTKNGNENITLVEYLHNNSVVNSVSINYDPQGYISRLTYKNGSTIVATTSLVFGDNDIVVIDDLSGYRIKYSLTSGRVTSFIDGFDTNFTNGHKSFIEYYDGYSVLTNYKGEKSYSFFDSDNLPTFEMDEDNNVVETEFDSETKILKSNSGSISFHTLENLFNSTDISSFTNDGLQISKANQDDDKFKGILGDSVYKVSGTGTLTKTISFNGLASDNVIAVLFGKQLTPSNDDSYVEVTLSAGGRDSDKFNKKIIDNQFELLTLGTTTETSFDTITLTIELVGNAEIELGGIKVSNKEFASFYAYDDSGNATEMGGGSKTTNMTYGSNNLPSKSIGVDSTYFDYEYDDYGNLIKAETAYGAKIENKYDSTYKSNLLSNKVTSKDGTKILETKKTYTSDGRFVASSTDELGNVTKYDEYDAFGKILKVTNALNTVSRFTYNGDGTLSKIFLDSGSDSLGVSYTYDSKKRLSKVRLDNGSVYNFVYDSLNDIKEIKLNDTVVFSYEYDASTDNLIKQTYGENSDAFIFEYNDDNLISSIYYQPKDGTKTLKFKYFYNEDKQLSRVEDADGNLLNKYNYDENNRVESVKTNNSEIKNTYDNLGNIVTKGIEIAGKRYYSSFDTVSRSKGSHPGAIYEPFSKLDAYIGMFEKNGVLSCQSENESILPFINHDYEHPKENVNVIKDGIIPCIKVSPSNRLSYALTNETYYNAPCGHISFWFKSDTTISTSTKKYLFSLHTSYVGNHISLGDNILWPDFIGVYLKYKRIYLEVIDENGKHYDLITSDYDVDLTKWNFVSLNFMNRYDGQGYADVCEYALVVNAHRQTFKQQDPRIFVDCDPNPVMNIGHKFDGYTSSFDFTGKITGLLIGRRTYLFNDTIVKFYRLTKDYIIDNQLVDGAAKTVDFSQTNLFTINQNILSMFDIYPLQNNVLSLTNKRPIKFNIRRLSTLDKDRTFNFNSVSKKYSYVADGEELIYDFGFSDSGTIAMRAYTDVREDKQYFFEGKDDNGQILGLYRNENNYVFVDVDGLTHNTGLRFENNSWHFVSLSFKESISSSNPRKYLDLRVLIDNKSWEISVASFEYSNLKFIIGRKYEEKQVSMALGLYYTTYPFYGQIEMIATRPAYCEVSTLNTLRNELVGLTKVSEFDDFGMLKKVDIHECGKSILSNTYEYKKRSASSKYISKQVGKEIIKSGSSTITRSYESDVLGNITKITDSTFGNHEYEYDFRGFLTKADGKQYIYDDNGNIVKKGNAILNYDSTIKDRLVSYNGIKISYDTANPLNPKTYGSNNYNFEGRRLVRWTYGGGYYDYVYNDQGLRIQKRDYRGVTWDYTYDGDKLICEKHLGTTLNFLYDENGSLYGFVKNRSEKYLYIRDSLQNILGIADISGKIVVKYDYDAWGTTSIKQDTSSSSIGYLNPFRYKGYYYDSESGMYYCKTRYYVPLWGRWLNADSPYNLSFDKFDGLNYYSYCGNNPIVGIDKLGKWLLFACLSALVGGIINGVSSIVTSIATEGKVDWKDATSSFVGGAVSGFIIGATGGTAVTAASYASAAAESITGEIWDYASGEKELSGDNILKSLGNIAYDTAINGTINIVTDKVISAKIPSLKTNSGWFKPKKVKSFFTKSYGKKIIKGTLVSAGIGAAIDIGSYYLSKIVEEFCDNSNQRNVARIYG